MHLPVLRIDHLILYFLTISNKVGLVDEGEMNFFVSLHYQIAIYCILGSVVNMNHRLAVVYLHKPALGRCEDNHVFALGF